MSHICIDDSELTAMSHICIDDSELTAMSHICIDDSEWHLSTVCAATGFTEVAGTARRTCLVRKCQCALDCVVCN